MSCDMRAVKKNYYISNPCVLGMLLELPVPVLTQMLQDEASLTAAVDKALRALQLAQESRYSNMHVLPNSLLHHSEEVALRQFVVSVSQMHCWEMSEEVFYGTETIEVNVQ